MDTRDSNEESYEGSVPRNIDNVKEREKESERERGGEREREVSLGPAVLSASAGRAAEAGDLVYSASVRYVVFGLVRGRPH